MWPLASCATIDVHAPLTSYMMLTTKRSSAEMFVAASMPAISPAYGCGIAASSFFASPSKAFSSSAKSASVIAPPSALKASIIALI